jgi:formylglycine-generating enzyme required for sulfatase activity
MNRVLAVLLGVMPLVGLSWTAAPAQSGEDEPKATERNHDFQNSIGMKLVLIPAGTFMMGSADNDKEAYDEEKPQHKVTISKAFYLGKYDVTRGQFRKFAEDSGYETEAERVGKGGAYDSGKGQFFNDVRGRSWKDPGYSQTDSHPVVNVTWNDAKRFCAWLSEKEAKRYDLPTEAEWEFACRAGTSSRYYFGDDEAGLQKYANVADLSLKAKWDYSNISIKDYQKGLADWFERVSWDDGYPFTAPVGQFMPNGFGLYDMHGNIYQWCQDWYGRDYYTNSDNSDPKGPSMGVARVLRGGSFDNYPRRCRAARRGRDAPGYRYYSIGFRLRLRPD